MRKNTKNDVSEYLLKGLYSLMWNLDFFLQNSHKPMAHSIFNLIVAHRKGNLPRVMINAQYKLRNYFREVLLTTIYMRVHDLVLYTGEIR